MATFRDSGNPYGAFNFRVTADPFNNDNSKIQGGFQEISGLNTEVTVAEYRYGTDPENHVRKINGIFKSGDVTLKRGVVGANTFFTWLNAVRTGDQTAPTTVTIDLKDETGLNTVMTWKLYNARPIKYTGPTLNAKGGTDVAIEELVLACEKVDVS